MFAAWNCTCGCGIKLNCCSIAGQPVASCLPAQFVEIVGEADPANLRPAERISWACCLYIDRVITAPSGGRVLLPHNVDGWPQAQLLLVVFTNLADDIILFAGN